MPEAGAAGQRRSEAAVTGPGAPEEEDEKERALATLAGGRDWLLVRRR